MRSVYERYARMRPEKPRTAEIAVDEMIAICNEIAAWKEKKKSEEANARYNDFLNEKSIFHSEIRVPRDTSTGKPVDWSDTDMLNYGLDYSEGDYY